jgi:hypothetical protein
VLCLGAARCNGPGPSPAAPDSLRGEGILFPDAGHGEDSGHCANGVKDGDETDADCGGRCPRCANGKRCGASTDCASGLCSINACVAAASCKALKLAATGVTTGRYLIDPDGSSSGTPFEVHCEMSTAGGGWTLVATLSNVDGVRNWSDFSAVGGNAWLEAAPLVGDTPELGQDYKSRAYGALAAQDLLILTDKGVWGTWTGLGDQPLLKRISGQASSCTSSSSSGTPLALTGSSSSHLTQSLIINATDGNNSCCALNPQAASCDAAVLGFSGTGDLCTGHGLMGLGQSWVSNVKGPSGVTVACGTTGCHEDFVSALGWRQCAGGMSQFFGTPLNDHDPKKEPSVIWLYVR